MALKEESLAQFASEKLVRSNSFNYIEGWTDDSGQLYTHRGHVSFDGLADFLNGIHYSETEESDNRSYRFRALSFPRLENERLKIALPKSTFEEIKRCWGLHDFTLEAFLNNNGILSSFNTQEKQCILMKVPASRTVGFDNVSVSHHRQQHITYVLYHSLVDEAGIFDTLLSQPCRCIQPTFFVAALYRCHQQRVEHLRNRINDEITAIEHDTKLGGPGRLFEQRYKREEPTLKINVKNTIQKLSYIQTELAVAADLARSSLKLGEWLVTAAQSDRRESDAAIVAANTARTGTGLETLVAENTWKTLDEVEYLKRRAETVSSQMQSGQDRVQSQTTFLLSTATQDQSDYTATIALETRRDSAAMKTIAIMTILFLPGTFVATLFSMNMFEWQPDEGADPKVSKYLWVYWVISVPLTLLVVIGWVLWTRREVGRLKLLKVIKEM